MPLERHKLDDFTRGWFVGNFSPTLISTDAAEVAVQRYQAGAHEPRHLHKVATELTLVVSGRARMNGEDIEVGQIIRIPPGTAADFEAVTDVTTVVIKVPCVKGDKYLCEPADSARPAAKR
jgi:mannose-6-phosphate isomerase-like protein (cupin superfamily)